MLRLCIPGEAHSVPPSSKTRGIGLEIINYLFCVHICKTPVYEGNPLGLYERNN